MSLPTSPIRLVRRAPWSVRFTLSWLAKPLRETVGEAEATAVLSAAELEIPPLLHSLPKLPPRRAEARKFLTAVAYLAGVYRALLGRGATPERAGAMVVAISRAALGRVPGPFRRIYRWWFFRPGTFKALAASLLGDPTLGDGADGDFQGEVVPGVYGVDYTGCAIQTWLTRQDLADFGPWVCLLDDVQSAVFGLGLERTGTLAHGAKRCDFRFAPHRPGRPLPPPTQPER